jgi:hypothetical protein
MQRCRHAVTGQKSNSRRLAGGDLGYFALKNHGSNAVWKSSELSHATANRRNENWRCSLIGMLTALLFDGLDSGCGRVGRPSNLMRTLGRYVQMPAFRWEETR